MSCTGAYSQGEGLTLSNTALPAVCPHWADTSHEGMVVAVPSSAEHTRPPHSKQTGVQSHLGVGAAMHSPPDNAVVWREKNECWFVLKRSQLFTMQMFSSFLGLLFANTCSGSPLLSSLLFSPF